MEKQTKENIYLKRTILVLIILVLSLTLTYAWLTISVVSEKKGSMIVGTLSLALKDDTSSGIFLDQASPVKDEVGMTYSPYSFSITNDGNITNNYYIYLDNEQITDGYQRMGDNYIKFNLTKNGVVGQSNFLSTISTEQGRLLDSGTLNPGEKNNYDLRLWIDYGSGNYVMNTEFAGKVRVEAEQIKE